MSNPTRRRMHALVATVGALLATLIAAGEARAAIVVNTNADPPGYNGPFCTLRMAVAAANGATNACGTGNVIQLGGPNVTFISLTKSIGPLVLSRAVTIQGNFNGQHPDFDTVTVSADPINGGQIFSIPGAPIMLSLKYLRLANGRDPTVNGGAVSVRNPSGSVDLNVVQIDHCSGANGGAVYAKGHVTIAGSSLHDNVALLGGALFFEADSGVGTITSTTFSKNIASTAQNGGFGGAIYLSQSSLITVQASTFFQNSAIYGGAIANFGHLEVYGSTFESNRANSTGGAIHGGAGDMIVGNDTITLNAASAGGGVFWNRTTAGYFELDRTTIVSNSGTGAGGGIDVNGTSGGTNKIGGQNIIAKNTSNNGPDILGDMANVGGINLVGNASGITSCPAGWIVADPLLGAYASVNNQPKSYALQSVSPAIDRGTGPIPGFAYDGVDQTAQPRPVIFVNGSTPYDLGSFELR